jgi:hypothetical protein
MILALKRLSVLAVAFLSIMIPMGVIAGPASASVSGTVGPFLTRDECNEERAFFLRYYKPNQLSNCFFDQPHRAFFFTYSG